MRRLFVTLGGLTFVSACGSPDKGFGESSEVHEGTLGNEWPLTVDSALLTCNEGVVSVQVEGQTDVIDRMTGTRSVSRRFVEIWAHDGSRANGRMDLSPLVEHAESLCE